MTQERIKIVTVLANENKYNLAPFRKRCATTHKATLIEFIYVTGIEIPNIDIHKTSSQELAYYLTKEGFIVVLEAEENNQKETNFYLPETFGKMQREYLNKVILKLDECKLSVFKLNSEADVLTYCEDASKNISSLNDLLNEIKVFEEDDNKQPLRLIKGL